MVSRCPSPLSLPRFPLSLRHNLSYLPSRFLYSASCSFPFVLPCFTPTAVPQVLAFRFRFRPFPFFFRFLSSASFPVLTTQLLFFRSLLPGLASQWLFQCYGSSFRLSRLPPSPLPGFPCFFSGFRYLASCSFPFILPGFAPTAVPPVFPFLSASFRPLHFWAFLLAFHFLSSI